MKPCTVYTVILPAKAPCSTPSRDPPHAVSTRTTHGVCRRSTTYADAVVPTRAPPTHEHASRHPARACTQTTVPAVRPQQLQHKHTWAQRAARRGAWLTSADTRTHMHCDSTRKPTVYRKLLPASLPRATWRATSSHRPVVSPPHPCGANASSTCALNLEPSAAATHTHGRALASCERASTMGVSAVWPTHTPRATQRGCRQGVACDRPGVAWGEGYRRARGCPGRMRSTGPTAAAA